MKKDFIKIFSGFMTVALIAVIALTGCEKTDTGAETTTADATSVAETTSAADATTSTEPKDPEPGSDVTEIGEGDTSFPFEVTSDSGDVAKFTVRTNEKNVGAALLALGLIEGSEGDYGLYVTVVNGKEANYDADGAYWAFYIDGEYAMTGVDATDIEPNKTYAFVYTKE